MPFAPMSARFPRHTKYTLCSLALALATLGALSCNGVTEAESEGPESPAPPGATASPAMSEVTVSKDVVEAGEDATVTLQARDAEGNQITTGGLTVDFTISGGSSLGSFGPTDDNADGTYEATFTGTVAGNPATIGATIAGEPVTSELPTIQVVAPPPPPGGVVREAFAPAQCWYVAADASAGGDGTFDTPFRLPQDAEDRAGPGDFIYLRGGAEFTPAQANGSVLLSSVSPGEEGAIITVKSYPGEQAVIRGDSPVNYIRISNTHNYRRFENLRIIHGRLFLKEGFAAGTHHLWAVGNHISDVAAPPGNFGVISVHLHQQQDPAGNPHHIFIYDNIIHDLTFDDNGTIRPWYQGLTTHHGCIMIQRADNGPVEIIGNECYHVPLALFYKVRGTAAHLQEDNYFHDLRMVGNISNVNNTWLRNRIINAGHWHVSADAGVGFGSSEADVVAVARENIVIRDATGPDEGPSNPGPAVTWPDEVTIDKGVFEDNIIFSDETYHNLKNEDGATPDWSQAQIDGNCVIGPSNLIGVTTSDANLSWDSYRSQFGHDPNGIRVTETDPLAVFADPYNGDLTLMGQAATACG